MYTCIATLTYAERYCNFPYHSVVFGDVWIVTRIILGFVDSVARCVLDPTVWP